MVNYKDNVDLGICLRSEYIKSTDFYNALAQADLPKWKYLYVELPTDLTCGGEKYILLNPNKSLYGQS